MPWTAFILGGVTVLFGRRILKPILHGTVKGVVAAEREVGRLAAEAGRELDGEEGHKGKTSKASS